MTCALSLPVILSVVFKLISCRGCYCVFSVSATAYLSYFLVVSNVRQMQLEHNAAKCGGSIILTVVFAGLYWHVINEYSASRRCVVVSMAKNWHSINTVWQLYEHHFPRIRGFRTPVDYMIQSNLKYVLVYQMEAERRIYVSVRWASLVQIWLVAWPTPSHYLNQCWNIDNWTTGNKFQWNHNQHLYIIIQENAFENVVRKLTAILSQPQCDI